MGAASRWTVAGALLACSGCSPQPEDPSPSTDGASTSTSDEPTTSETGLDASSGSTTETFEGTPPIVSIAFPTSDVVVSGVDVRVEFEVEDPDGIAGISVEVDGVEVASSDEPTNILHWSANAIGSGEHELSVVARDTLGAEGEAVVTTTISTRGSDGDGGATGSVDREATIGATTRAYYLYVPSSYDRDVPLPIVTAHHGAGGPTNKGETYRDLWLDTAEAGGFVVLAQDSLDDDQGGWLAADRDFWIEATESTLAEYNIDTSRIYVWGFSAGGHFSHLLGMTYPETIAAYAVNSGTLGPFGLLGAPAGLTRQIPVAIWCGSTDPNRPACELARDTFMDAGWTLGRDLQFTIFEGYHEIPDGNLADAWTFLSGWQLP